MTYPLPAELRVGFAAWSVFILATCAYCLVHQAFVIAVTPDVSGTLTVALREWGAWAVLAPWALREFRGFAPRQWREIVLRCVMFGVFAAVLPVVADLITGNRAFGASFALFTPRNFAMAVALFFISRLLTRPAVVPGPVSAPAPVAEPALPVEKPATLLVSKGADQCLIRIDDIQHLSAAGNYVDIRARDQSYLLRATMGDVEQLLSPDHFVRIHRSHIVRVREIERIRLERSGSGTVHLRGGAALSISRSYRAQLKRHQEGLKPRVH